MDTKKVIVTLPVSIYNYALRQGKTLNEGIVNIIKAYREMDAENITAKETVMDEIADMKSTTSAISSDLANELDKLESELEDDAVVKGLIYKETKDKAVFFEYSPYSFAIVGDTKPSERREIIKGVDGVRFVGNLSKFNNASGWCIPKKAMSTDEEQRVFLASLEKTGLEVEIGESVVTAEELEEAKAKAKPKTSKTEEPKPTKKVVSLKSKKTSGVCIEPAPKGSEEDYQSVKREVSALSGGLYYNYDKDKNGSRVYFCVGHDDECDTDVYCMLGACKGDAATTEIPNRQAFDYIRQHGVYKAFKDGKLPKVFPHMVWAYAEVGDEKMVELLEAC